MDVKYKTELKKSRSRLWIIYILLITILITSMLISMKLGTAKIKIGDIIKIIFNKLFNLKLGGNIKKSHIDIIHLIRGPRIVLAAIVGMGLSISGLVMQGIVRNPIADPYILGISSGASLGATLAISLGMGQFLGDSYIGIFAFIGAFLTALIVIFIGNLRGRSDVTMLLLSGVAINSLATALSSLVIYFSKEKEGIRNITYWLMGSFSGATWKNNIIIGIIVGLTIIFFYSQSRILNLMLLGDEVALTLGTDLSKIRIIYLLLISLNVGLIVFASGVIGFIGLIVPHVTRMVFGSNHKNIVILNTLIGGIFVVIMDGFSRSLIRGVEIPIGILISIVGSPIFIYLIFKQNKDLGGKDSGN